jgi:hypothetical protein
VADAVCPFSVQVRALLPFQITVKTLSFRPGWNAVGRLPPGGQHTHSQCHGSGADPPGSAHAGCTKQ